MNKVKIAIQSLKGLGPLWLVISSSLLGHPESDFGSIDRRITELFSDYSGGVFSVYAAHATYDERGELENILKIGTGFFISKEGYILTTASVMMNSDRTWFTIEGVSYSSELIGAEPVTNIALLKANNFPKDVPYFMPEVNQSLPEIGSMAIMVSCPLGFEPAPSLVMVSGLETKPSRGKIDTTHFRIDRSIVNGEVGAPIIDIYGRFQGVLIGSFPELASGYVLPTKAVIRIRDDLLFTGKYVPGWIGIGVQSRSTVSRGRQVFLTEIAPDSPAAKAGLKKGDVLVRIGDFDIQSVSDIQNAMFFARVGQYLKIRVKRADDLEGFSVEVEKHPEDQNQNAPTEITNPSETKSPATDSDSEQGETPS